MSRVLVTGATGIVGSWLVKELLARGKTVVVLILDHDPSSELIRSGDVGRTRVINGRLESFRDVERAILLHEVDTVFHLGARTLVGVAHRSPVATFETNIQGTWNVLEACRLHGVRRLVVASSDKVYGEQVVLPYTERMGLDARNPYDVSKSCTDLLAQTYAATYGVPVSIARCGNIYGGGDLNWSRIVPGTIRSLLRGERPVIRSDGTYIRDYLYVKDAVDAYLTLAEADIQGEAFNFSPGNGVTVRGIVDEIRKVMGREDIEPDIRNTAKAEIRAQTLDSAKARELLGWRHRYELSEGLQEAVRWYREFLA